MVILVPIQTIHWPQLPFSRPSLTWTVCTPSAGTLRLGKDGRRRGDSCRVFRKSKMAEGTLNAVFEILAWSLEALQKGTFPEENWHGCADGRGGSLQAAFAELFAKFVATGPFALKSSSYHNGTVHCTCEFFAVPARRLRNFSGRTQGQTRAGARPAGPTRPAWTSCVALATLFKCCWLPSLDFGWSVSRRASCTRWTGDQGAAPGAPDVKRAMKDKADVQAASFGLAVDIEGAHNLVPVREEDWRHQRCRVGRGEGCRPVRTNG